MDGFNSPILFIIFNRPETTRRVFSVIKAIKPKFLFIAADGPRVGVADDAKNCMLTRDIINEVDWVCTLKTLFHETNLGCMRNVVGAIDWFFLNVTEGIILEDDCLPDYSFFGFCQELLEKYKSTDRVSIISGNNFQKFHRYLIF